MAAAVAPALPSAAVCTAGLRRGPGHNRKARHGPPLTPARQHGGGGQGWALGSPTATRAGVMGAEPGMGLPRGWDRQGVAPLRCPRANLVPAQTPVAPSPPPCPVPALHGLRTSGAWGCPGRSCVDTGHQKPPGCAGRKPLATVLSWSSLFREPCVENSHGKMPRGKIPVGRGGPRAHGHRARDGSETA